MRRMNAKKIYMTKWDRLLCPNIHQILENNKVDAAACTPTWVGGLQFEINCMHSARYVVDLANQTCKCKK